MIDQRTVVSRLRSLTIAFAQAQDEAQRAALYGASRWLLADLNAAIGESAPNLGEKIVTIESNLFALLGAISTDARVMGDPMEAALEAISALDGCSGEL